MRHPVTRRLPPLVTAAGWMGLGGLVPLRAHSPAAAMPGRLGLSSHALDRITPSLQVFVDSGKVAGVVALVARHGRAGRNRARRATRAGTSTVRSRGGAP